MDNTGSRIEFINNKYGAVSPSRIRTRSFSPAPSYKNEPFLIPSNLFPPAHHPEPATVTAVSKVVRPVTTRVVPTRTVVAPAPFYTTALAPVTTSVFPASPIIKQTVETIEESPPQLDRTGHFDEASRDYWEPALVPSDTRKHAIDTAEPPKAGCCQRCSTCLPRCCGCPWWLCLFIGLLFSLLIFGAVGFGLKLFPNLSLTKPAVVPNQSPKSEPADPVLDEKEQLSCNKDFFLFNGKCLKCPERSTWNGTNCIKQELINKTFIAKIVRNSTGEYVVENKTIDGQQGWITGQPKPSHLHF